jgi:hypothetical protein
VFGGLLAETHRLTGHAIGEGQDEGAAMGDGVRLGEGQQLPVWSPLGLLLATPHLVLSIGAAVYWAVDLLWPATDHGKSGWLISALGLPWSAVIGSVPGSLEIGLVLGSAALNTFLLYQLGRFVGSTWSTLL